MIVIVSDNGVGMDERTVAVIQQQSVQSTTGTNREVGYGLGLQLVRQLTAELGGMLTISSKPHWGSKFQVSLPEFLLGK